MIFPLADLLALRDFAAGAMENWGLITFYQSDMLYEEGVTTYRQKQRVAVVVAHELAHQVRTRPLSMSRASKANHESYRWTANLISINNVLCFNKANDFSGSEI